MVVGSDRPSWRELGQRLAHVLRQNPGTITTPARLQGLVADLAADQQELLLPLKDLVNRPAFQALIPRAGSGSGAVQRDVLIQAMEATFSRQVIQALAEVLDGFLDLPPGSARAAAQPAASAAPPSPLPAPPPAPTPVRPRVRPAAPAPVVRRAEPGPPVFRLLLLSLATALAVLAGAAGVVLLRSTDLCALVGFCPGSGPASSALEALAAAERAAGDLGAAGTLRAYERALEELEQQLLTLSTARLTPEQEEQRQQLDQTAREARAVLAEERSDARRLEKAARALGAARASAGADRAGQLAIATAALDAIPPRSFSAGEATMLRRQLQQLAQEVAPSEPAAAEPEPDSPPDGAPAVEPEAPAQQPAPPLTPPPPLSPPPIPPPPPAQSPAAPLDGAP